MPQRLDQEIVDRHLSASRAQAQRAIRQGYVTVDGELCKKASRQVGKDTEISINDPEAQYVSRGALKLAAILGDVDGKIALDVGASTGGFTQLLLERGARLVFAVDVGHGQLHPKIADDKRVVSVEGLNAKEISPLSIDHPNWPHFEAITVDLSFISLTKALEATLKLAQSGSMLYALIKPQFELSPAEIGKGGIVKEAAAAQKAVEKIERWLRREDWQVERIIPSPIKGGDGNQEYLCAARKR